MEVMKIRKIMKNRVKGEEEDNITHGPPSETIKWGQQKGIL